MIHRVLSRTDHTCVWMNAGLLTYKLCDRNFDCEHCPLDAALRGCSRTPPDRRETFGELGREVVTFPGDRLYSTGHTWLKPLEGGDGRLRFGIDDFATLFIAGPRRVRRTPSHHGLIRGETLCEIDLDLGGLTLAAPVSADVTRWNRALEDDPGVVITAPYDDGWIVELVVTEQDDMRRLLIAQAAREQAWLDTRRFRRRLALQILSDEHDPDASPDPQRRLPDDLRQILGGSRYLALVRELIH